MSAQEGDHPPLDTSSSPGWKEAPHDVSVLVGGYVTFNCRSVLRHTETVWLKDGRRVTSRSDKFSISADGVTARYGPVGVEDSGTAIGCEVKTMYGRLPSHQAKITVHSELVLNS